MLPKPTNKSAASRALIPPPPPAPPATSTSSTTPSVGAGTTSTTCFNFVNFDADTNHFEVSSEAKEILSHIKTPFTVVAVVGTSRGGKSSLLNLLLNRSIFPTSAGVQACTLGLNACFSADHSVLYVDSQGLFDWVIDDFKVIAACAMMADLFVYNTTGAIDTSKINPLATGVSLAREKSQLDTARIQAPSLLWLERDLTLNLGQFSDANQYLEAALAAKAGATKEAIEANRSRGAIKEYFKKRNCIRLPLPSGDIATQRNLGPQHLNSLNSEFRAGVMAVSQLVKDPEAKRIATARGLRNGNDFVLYVHQVLQALNGVDLPAGGIFAQLERKALSDALIVAAAVYQSSIQRIRDSLPCDDDVLIQKHTECVDAIALTLESRNQSGGIQFNVKDALPKAFTQKQQLQCLQQDNQSRSEEHCHSKELSHMDDFSAKAKTAGIPSRSVVDKLAKDALTSFSQVIVGPAAIATMVRFKQWVNTMQATLNRAADAEGARLAAEMQKEKDRLERERLARELKEQKERERKAEEARKLAAAKAERERKAAELAAKAEQEKKLREEQAKKLAEQKKLEAAREAERQRILREEAQERERQEEANRIAREQRERQQREEAERHQKELQRLREEREQQEREQEQRRRLSGHCHGLQQVQSRVGMTCDVCNRYISVGDSFWHCPSGCNYDECEGCFTRSQSRPVRQQVVYGFPGFGGGFPIGGGYGGFHPGFGGGFHYG